MSRSALSLGLVCRVAMPCAAVLILAAGTVIAQSGFANIMSYAGGFGGRAGPARGMDFDWDAVTGEGSADMFAGYGRGGMGGRGQSDGDKPLVFKSDLGKAVQKMRFDRTTSSVLAARVKLAEQDRKALISPAGPPAPEEDDTPATPAGPGGMNLGGDGVGISFDGEMIDQGLGEIDISAMAARAEAMMAAMGASSAGEPSLGGDDAAASPDAPGAGGKVDAKAEARKQSLKFAKQASEQFQLIVGAGHWARVGAFLRDQAAEDAPAMYTFLLQSLAMGDAAAVPGDVLALSEIAPVDLEERHVKLLGTLLRNTAGRGGDPSAVAARIKVGTTYFGGPDLSTDQGPATAVERRAANRKRAATLLIAAGLTIEAQAYLAPLAVAIDKNDAELLNLYTVYFEALGKKKDGAERQALQKQGWEVALKVLTIPAATQAQRADRHAARTQCAGDPLA